MYSKCGLERKKTPKPPHGLFSLCVFHRGGSLQPGCVEPSIPWLHRGWVMCGAGVRGKRTLRSSLQETPRREEPKTRLQLRWSEFGISEVI